VRNVLAAAVASLFLAAVMTFGDFTWAALRLEHHIAYGIAHGAVMCLCVGLAIGKRAGRVDAGLVFGPLIGVVAALVFYALAARLGWGAMLPAWMVLWILFALMQERLDRTESVRVAALRGVIAAILSGSAFYAISGIWTRHSTAGPNYPVHFLSWTFAFLPGFLALFAFRAPQQRRSRP
jgi:hypothetical protein